MTAYRALALQTRVETIHNLPDVVSARELMHRTIDRIGGEVAAAVAWTGGDLRLVVLPESCLTGPAIADPVAEWTAKAAIDIDGPEYERFGDIASSHNVFIAGTAFERDENFPDLNFHTCFIVAPDGKVVLRYRRLHSLTTPTPYDVWDRYLDIYGYAGIFPVAATEIGVLAAIAGDEILHPEVARAFLMRGAEVFVHPTAQANDQTAASHDVCAAARAVENMAYVVSANAGGIQGGPRPGDSINGGSKIIDHRGLVIAKSGVGATMTCAAEIDLGALRRCRTRAGADNLVASQRFALFAEGYRTLEHFPPNTLLTAPPERSHFLDTQRATIARLVDEKVVRRGD